MKSSPNTDSSEPCARRQPEVILVRDALRRLEQTAGFSVCCYVPLLGRCVDLAYVEGEFLTTVEFKLHDWRTAIQQARDHRLAADYAYICMPRRTVTERMRAELARSGVGLTFYREDGDWPFEVVVKAPRSHETWSVAHSALWKYVLGNGESSG